MESKIKNLEGTSKQLDITVPAVKVNSVLGEIITEIRNEVTIPGFRKGKAPVDLVFKHYRDDAMDQLKKRLIPEACQKVMDDHKISPVSYPEITGIEIDSAGALVFTAKIDTHPEVKLAKYDGIKVTSEKVKVDDADIEETIKRLTGMYAEFIPAERSVAKGDFAVCEVEAFIGGKSISKKRDSVWIEATKEGSMLGMGEELCGLKKGDAKEIDVTLPEAYPDKQYAGKKAEFKVLVKDVREKKVPAADDEFAKKLGKDTMLILREDIKKELLEGKENGVKIKMKNQIIDHLLKKHEFNVPESMVKRQTEVLMNKAKEDLLEKGVSAEAIESEKANLTAKIVPEAKNKVKLYFILDAVAGKENIEVSDDDVERWIQSIADYYRQPVDEVKKYYQDNDLLGGVKEEIREDKTLDLLLEKAVKDVK